MSRVYNFSAGPSMLPEEVLRQVADEMLDYNGTGQSVAEMSHRSKEFQAIMDEAMALVKEILSVPDDYEVLFLQGGGSTQFAAIPLNFMNKNNKADYIVTGKWANDAYKEACKYGDVRLAASSKDKNYSYIPKVSKDDFRPDADYVYYCINNTIYGTTFHYIPETNGIPLIADISSAFLSEPIDVTKFDVLYGGAQKNIAPAGLVIAVVKKSILGNQMDITPTMLNWQVMADKGSMYNTPPCFIIYMCMLNLRWIKKNGGLEGMQKRNIAKATLLYDCLDNSKLFKPTAVKEDRSLMNVCFVTGDADLDAKFVAEAKNAGLVNVKGHRSVGGMRASIYNAMPYEGVVALVDFMKKFEAENG